MLLGSGPLGPRRSDEGSVVAGAVVVAAGGGGTGGAVCVSVGARSCVCGVSCSGCAATGGTAIMAAAAIANGERKDFIR